MNKIKLSLLVLAALALAALLTLAFSKREVYLPWVMPAAPSGTMVPPAKPAVKPVNGKKTVSAHTAAGRTGGAIKAPAAPGKPGKKRRKRVSQLREPGEALGGSVQLDLPDKTTDVTLQKK